MTRLIKTSIWVSGAILFIFSITIPPIFGMDIKEQRSLGLFVLAVSFWMTNKPVPAPVTGVLVLSLSPLLGIMEASEAFSHFGNKAVFFILGSLILSGGLIKTGLARRISIFLLSLFPRTPFGIVIGVFCTSYFLAYFITEHAVAALLFPIVIKFGEMFPKSERRVHSLLFLALAWGSVIGGITTPLGGARIPFALGFLSEEYKISLSFLDYVMIALPYSLSLFSVSLLVIYILVPKNALLLRTEEMREERPLDWIEVKTLAVFLFTLILWIFFSRKIDTAVVAILGASLLFLLKVVNWKDIEGYVNWGVILMYGGAVVLGRIISDYGPYDFLLPKLIKETSNEHFVFMYFSILTILLTEGMSNVAACATVIPFASKAFINLGLSPAYSLIAVGLTSGLAFLLPISSPPYAIAFSSGKFSIGTQFRLGIIYNLISIFLVGLFWIFYWRDFF